MQPVAFQGVMIGIQAGVKRFTVGVDAIAESTASLWIRAAPALCHTVGKGVAGFHVVDVSHKQPYQKNRRDHAGKEPFWEGTHQAFRIGWGLKGCRMIERKNEFQLIIIPA